MKYLISFLVLIFSITLSYSQFNTLLLSEGGMDCPVVDPTNDSRPHMASCIAGLEKHLARAINVRGFDKIYRPTPHQDCGTIELAYCPQKYREIVNRIADLNAGYIMNAAGLWGNDHLYSVSKYQTAVTNLVNDINNAYDCKGQRRPLIQASLWETVDPNSRYTWPSPLSSTSPGILIEVNEISTEVMVEFFGEMTDQEKDRYFTNRDISMPLNTVYYELDRIIIGNGNETPDATQVEARMWMYQQARFFIDAGFTAIKFGQANKWGRVDDGGGIGTGPGGDLVALTSVIDKVRAYADARQMINYPPGQNPKGIILTLETFGGDLYRNNDPTDELLFDHNSYGYHGNEIDINSLTSIEEDFLSVATACDTIGARNSLLELFPDYRLPPNDNDFPRWGLPGTKKSSRGCPVSGNRPFSIYLDNAKCVEGTVGELTKDGGALWGYDDKAWFANELSETCKADWMEYEIQAARVLDNYGPKAFMEASAVIDNAKCYDAWTFADDPSDAMFTAIQNAWEVNPLTPSDIGLSVISYSGSGHTWKISINNPDNTSIYSIHIKKPNNSGWIPFNYGLEKTAKFTQTGLYTIIIRQDNVGIEQSMNAYGVNSFSIPIWNYVWGGGFKVSSDTNQEIISKNYALEARRSTDLEIQEVEESSPFGESFTLGTEENTNIKNKRFEREFQPLGFDVFPNPMTDKFTIRTALSKTGNLKLSLFNTLGKKIKELASETISYKGNYTYEGNLSDLPAGTYLVLLEFDGKVQMQKLFKQ